MALNVDFSKEYDLSKLAQEELDNITSKVRHPDESANQGNNGGNGSWNRGLKDVNDFAKLKNNGIVKVNSSGSDRPLTSVPNSYYSTGNGEHIFAYDGGGKLIYDISNKRVKSFKLNVAHNGVEHYKAYKLIGFVPEAIKKIFGW